MKISKENELLATIGALRTTAIHREKEIENRNKNIKNLLIQVKRLEYRLDACLYSMILMQNQVRRFEDNCEENHMEKPKLAI